MNKMFSNSQILKRDFFFQIGQPLRKWELKVRPTYLLIDENPYPFQIMNITLMYVCYKSMLH